MTPDQVVIGACVVLAALSGLALLLLCLVDRPADENTATEGNHL